MYWLLLLYSVWIFFLVIDGEREANERDLTIHAFQTHIFFAGENYH